ncbi:MAG: hypothetical protein JW751_22765 [Polyangiaceae bacterium]|nr:hypothetical protein [Polyangiaceae bacterium]
MGGADAAAASAGADQGALAGGEALGRAARGADAATPPYPGAALLGAGLLALEARRGAVRAIAE